MTLDFIIPDTCLDVTTRDRPGLKNPSLNLSECSSTIGGTSCPCSICNEGSGIELGQECVTLLSEIVPTMLTDIQEFDELFTFSTDPICIGGDSLLNGRGVVDIMLAPYLSKL